MASRGKETGKSMHVQKKPSGKERKEKKEKKEKYALIRDQATDGVRVVPFHEIVSSKDLAKLAAGDLVTHGLRGQRIRAMIVLVGEFFVVCWKCMNR